MFTSDIIGLVLSYIYASGLLGLAELLHRKLDVPQFYTRKFVHIWAGMWALATMALFYRWWMGIIPFATFILVNYVLYRTRLAKSVDGGEQRTLGTVYFALAITLLFGLLWRRFEEQDYGPIALAGVMAMTWGDALAAIAGKSFGRHTYTVLGYTRSYEGSAVMFLVSFAVILAVLVLLPGTFVSPFAPVLSLGQALGFALIGAAVAALAEAVSPAGLDNLTVPVLTSGALWLLVR
ncbi:MAG: phosphatidate cytidylyltransferase [Roseiflexaceae bacterium]|nr:phosphatidate cytidylyltransferase [Roseiflexaceae bacterium]